MTTTRAEVAAKAALTLSARMDDASISAAQLASVSAELRRWLDTVEPEPLSAEMRCRAAMTLLEHGSRGKTISRDERRETRPDIRRRARPD